MSPDYSHEPAESQQFSEQFDAFYSRFAKTYDWLIKTFPLWRNWLENVLPWIQGPRVLEVSFGTGYLLTRFAGQFETFGVDLNRDLAFVARHNLLGYGLSAQIQIANVEALPYPPATFDTVINTMAFSGYPDAKRALREMARVLKPGARLVMLDINFPQDGNMLGTLLTKGWQASGDIIRDTANLLESLGFDFSEQEVGGYGSLHLYVATKPG